MTSAPILCLWRRNFCAAGGVLFSYSGAILERLRNPFIDYSGEKYARLALPILRDVITSVSSKNSHKAPLKPLGHLRLREQRRQPLQKFAQKVPQPPALKPPSTARTAGRSDRAERRFRRQPFILLSFSSSKKAQKAQKTQSYQRFQHIVHTDFNTSGTNGPRLLSRAKVGTHSAFGERSHTAAYTAKHGVFCMGALSLPSERFARFGNPARPGVRTANFATFGSWSGVLPKNAESLRDSDAFMRVAVPRRRGPAGLREPILLLQRGYFCTATSLANSWNFQSRLLDVPTSIAKPSVFCYNILKCR